MHHWGSHCRGAASSYRSRSGNTYNTYIRTWFPLSPSPHFHSTSLTCQPLPAHCYYCAISRLCHNNNGRWELVRKCHSTYLRMYVRWLYATGVVDWLMLQTTSVTSSASLQCALFQSLTLCLLMTSLTLVCSRSHSPWCLLPAIW